jgi:uncharacterized protein with GYD domain
MATFISTIKFTEQGIKAIGETTKQKSWVSQHANASLVS